MKEVYILEHVYEIDEIEEIKYIGVFSTFSKANEVIEKLKSLSGFIEYPVECFQISKERVDEYGWKEGF